MTDINFRAPSIGRYRRVFRGNRDQSILRCLEYERLSELCLTGRVLDFGGGKKSNYASETPAWGHPEMGYAYESANIDPRIEPTHLLTEDGVIPVEGGTYDTVISLNTLEHVRNLSFVITEIRRVLAPGGRFIFIVPFIFRVHGHPDDYLRGTPSFWTGCLTSHGFEVTEIEAMTWGPFSTALTVSGIPGPFKELRRVVSLWMDVIYFSRYRGRLKTRLKQDSPLCNAPIGYYIEAVKSTC